MTTTDSTGQRPTTPGYTHHLDIWFKATKTGRRAYFFSTMAGRALPLPLLDAESWVSTGDATEIAGHPFKG